MIAIKLQCHPNLQVSLRRNDSILLTIDGAESYSAGPYTLAILDVFCRPKTFAEGLDALKQRIGGMQAWVEISQQIYRLIDVGVLQGAEERVKLPLDSHSGRFDAFPVHLRMLYDKQRVTMYQQAIRKVVRPEDIVVDIGTGSGVLAVTAALAGAKQVYAIECCGIAKVAREVFAANGVADRITLIEEKSTDVTLLERADVMVSEIIGNDPLQEGILSTTGDALKRLLKKDARLIPGRLKIYAQPLSVPDWLINRHVVSSEAVSLFKDIYKIDFSPLLSFSRRQSHHLLYNSAKTKTWPKLTPPVLLADLDLSFPVRTQVRSDQWVPITATGILNAILVYFEIELAEGIIFSISPEQVTESNSWSSKLWAPGTPLALQQGQELRLVYVYDNELHSSFEISLNR